MTEIVFMLRPIFIFILITAAIGLSGCTGTAAPGDAPGAANTDASATVFNSADEALAEGKRLMDANETEKAIAAFEQAVALDPDMGEAYFQLGIAHALIENEQRGKLLEGDPTATAPGEKTDKAKTESEKAFEKAVTAYKKQLESDPDNDLARFNLGRALNKLNKDEEAEKAFKEAVKLKPDDTEYQTELGAILIKLAQYREAIPPLKKAIELDTANMRAQELLDDAEAGRQRIDYVAVKKDDRKGDRGNTDESEPEANTVSANANTSAKKIHGQPMPITLDPKLQPSANKPKKP